MASAKADVGIGGEVIDEIRAGHGLGERFEIQQIGAVQTKAGYYKLQVGTGATEMASALAPCGVEVVSVPQGWKLTPAISWIERRLAEGKLKHHGSQLLRLNVANAVIAHVGNARSISKATTVGKGKIDGVAATDAA